MPILDVQRRYRELGRLRLGARRHTEGGKVVPVRLSTWRLTSPARWLLEAAAERWGGEVEAWADAPTEGEQWQVVTEASELEVYVPPQDVDSSQWYELWSGGGVQRRCDGVTEVISGGACRCDPDPERRECSVTTHLLVLLPQLPDVGVWRVRTTSWNAATELPPTVELLRRIHQQGAYPLGLLGIESRTTRAQGQTRHYSLPVLRFPSSIADAERAGIPVLSRSPERPALPADQPHLPADARFQGQEAAGWGAPPELPEAEPAAEDAEGVAEPVTRGRAGIAAPSAGSWQRYSTAAEAIGDSAQVRYLVMPMVRTGRWGWPPTEDWPADRLDRMAEQLERHYRPEQPELEAEK